jgi:hypothetical protein
MHYFECNQSTDNAMISFLFSLITFSRNKQDMQSIINQNKKRKSTQRNEKESEIYSLVQTLRGHEHDLGAIGHLQCPQRHRIDQNLPFEDELLATSEDISEGLEKGFEVSDRRVV